MDYLKVPELPEYWDEKMYAWIERTREVSDVFNSDGSHTFLAMLLRSVYTPTTGLLAQIEDQKRVIEELQDALVRIKGFSSMPAIIEMANVGLARRTGN